MKRLVIIHVLKDFMVIYLLQHVKLAHKNVLLVFLQINVINAKINLAYTIILAILLAHNILILLLV